MLLNGCVLYCVYHINKYSAYEVKIGIDDSI